MEGRIAVEEFWNRADAMVEEFLFVTHQQAVHIAQLAVSEYLQTCLHVECSEPGPGCSLMISIVALNLRTYIHRVVAVTLRRERTHALRSDEFLRAIVEHTLLLNSIERRVVEGDCEDHVGAYIIVAIAVHTIVAKVAVFVEEHRSEVLLTKLGSCLKLLDELLVLHDATNFCREHQGVVPERIYLHDESCSGNDRTTADRTVHPSNSLVFPFAADETILLDVEVRMPSCPEPFHDVPKQAAILLDAFLHRDEVRILLDTPDCPEQDIGMLYLCHADSQLLAFDELADCLLCSLHDSLELVSLVVGQGQSWQRNEHVASPALEPRIASQDVVLMFAMNNKLMGTIYERIIEVVSRRTYAHFKVRKFSQRVRVNFFQTGSKDHALAFRDAELEVTRHIEVFVRSIAAFLLLRIFQTAIPVRTEHELILLVDLHEEGRVTLIHASGDAVLNHVIVAVYPSVLMRELTYTSESKEGLQAKCSF